MHISEQMIERVLSGNGSEDEKRQVAAFFNNNPEKLAQYLTEKSWEDFEPATADKTPGPEMRAFIEEKLGRAPVRKIRYGWMAAAAVILIIGLIAFLKRADNNKKEGSAIAKAPASVPVENKTRQQTIKNEWSKARTFSLPDGSTLRLGGNSECSFDASFVNNRRDIYLKGEAVFTVIKDKTKPFTVHSKGIATTALGTVFGVDDKQQAVAVVHLYSGRVVVKKEETTGHQSFKDVYLQPGQELVLNRDDFSVQVKMSAAGSTVAKAAKPAQPHVLTFTRQSLSDILATLQKEYKVTIQYDAGSMKNIDFTGTFDNSKETIASFLGTLCDLNDLTLTTINSNSFSIQAK